jgi:aminoglycoside 3-N-acetyltransferase
MTSTEATIERLAADLRALGVRKGGVLLVHSSLRSLGPLPGRAETAVRGLLAALGEGGTLLMPALTYETVHSRNPVFDMQATPSCVGALTEYFRTRPGTRRSIHPTHSVTARGARAAEFLADHELDTTPVGPHSPFRKLRDAGGQLLFLGCGLRPNTSMHGVEELVEPPYLFAPELDFRILLSRPGGGELTMRLRRHNFVGWEQRYDRLGSLMEGKGLRTGAVLAAPAHLLEAAPMWDVAFAKLRSDPLCFVDRISTEFHE